jgi:hypothetical protein
MTQEYRRHDTLMRNVEYAIAAAVSTVLPLYFVIKGLAGQDEARYFPNRNDLFFLALFPVAYLLAALIIWLCRNTLPGRKIPHWLALPFIGSFLFVFMQFIYVTAVIHGTSFITRQRLFAASLLALALSAYTTIFTSLVHYLPSFIAALKGNLRREETTLNLNQRR